MHVLKRKLSKNLAIYSVPLRMYTADGSTYSPCEHNSSNGLMMVSVETPSENILRRIYTIVRQNIVLILCYWPSFSFRTSVMTGVLVCLRRPKYPFLNSTSCLGVVIFVYSSTNEWNENISILLSIWRWTLWWYSQL
jgi:hypothetical protein